MKNQNLELEKTLIEKTKSDKKYFDELYKYFLNDVYRFSYSLVNNKENAEDITSKTFILFYEKIDSFDWKGISLKHWLFQVARNYAYNKYKEINTETFDEEFHIENEYEISFVDEVLNKDLLQKVKEEIQNLNPVEQEVINLRIWEGMQFSEIASIQNASEITTKQRFYRSIEKIKKNLEKKNIKSLLVLPLLFTAISQVGSSAVYAAPMALGSLGIGTLITNTTMSTTLTSIKAFLASKAGAAVIATTVLVGSAGTAAVYYANNNDRKNTNNSVTESTPVPTMTSEPVINTSPSPTLTPQNTDFATYSNIFGGYEISYPTNWVTWGPNPKTFTGGGLASCTIDPGSDNTVNTGTSSYSVVEFSKITPTSCGWLGGESLPNSTSEFTIYVSSKPTLNIDRVFPNPVKTSINGVDAYKYDFIETPVLPNIKATRIYFNYNNKGYILYLKQNDAQGNYDPIYNEILKTLKFNTSPVIQNATPKISFVKTKNTIQTTDDELWISEIDGTNPQKLEVGEVSEAYNTRSKDYIFFKKPRPLNATADTLSVYNLNTKQVKEIVENDFDEGFSYIQGQNSISVSPNSEVIVYSLSYTQKECVHVCSPIDDYPQYKSGIYSYNLKTDKRVYLGKFLIVSNWDKDSKHVYTRLGEKYHEYDLSKGDYKINVDTGKATLVLEGDNFNTASSHLEEQQIVIKGSGGFDSTLQQLIVQKAGKDNLIFEAPGLAFQPTVYISPDRTQFLFIKTSTTNLNKDMMLVNLKDLSMRMVFQNNDQRTSLPIWVDNQNFIITIGPKEYDKGQDLYIININTKTQKKLTTSRDITLW